MSDNSTDNSKGTCAFGGLWYTCPTQTPPFFGCCNSNPCTPSGCPPNDLTPASLGISSDPNASTNEITYYPNVSCATGEWWTCSAQTPSFQGCCISNPCGGDGSTCPEGNLFPAAFASVSSAAPTNTVTLSSSASGTLQSTAGAATTSTSTNLSTPLPSAASSSKTNIGAIAGGAAGGACLFLLAIVGLSIYLCRRRRQKYTPSSNPLNPQTEPDDFSYDPNSPKEMEAKGSEFKHEYTRVPEAGKHDSMVSALSPGPPAYQSPQLSQGEDTYEIDSNTVHEFGGGERVVRSKRVDEGGRRFVAELVGSPIIWEGDGAERVVLGVGR